MKNKDRDRKRMNLIKNDPVAEVKKETQETQETQDNVTDNVVELKKPEVSAPVTLSQETINKVAQKIMANSNLFVRCLELSTYDKITLTNVTSLPARSLKKLIEIYALQSIRINEDQSIVLFFPEGTLYRYAQTLPKDEQK